MKEERTEEVETWPKPQSVRDIQLLQRFHRRLHRIAVPLTSMLQTTDELTGDKPQSTQAKKRMHLVVLEVLVVLVVLMELVEVTKICQVPGSWEVNKA